MNISCPSRLIIFPIPFSVNLLLQTTTNKSIERFVGVKFNTITIKVNKNSNCFHQFCTSIASSTASIYEWSWCSGLIRLYVIAVRFWTENGWAAWLHNQIKQTFQQILNVPLIFTHYYICGASLEVVQLEIVWLEACITNAQEFGWGFVPTNIGPA